MVTKPPSFIENQNVRLITAITFVLFVVGLVASEVQHRTNLARDIDALVKDVAELNAKIVGRSPEGWHKTQMSIWCAETERLNRKIGWNCARVTKEWP